MAFEGFRLDKDGSHRLWLSARALVEITAGRKDLWLSATSAVVNGGRWLRVMERRSEKLVPNVSRPHPSEWLIRTGGRAVKSRQRRAPATVCPGVASRGTEFGPASVSDDWGRPFVR
jgi:hypothetical protein